MNFYLNNQYKKDASKFFINFYKQEAKKYITERLKEIAEKYSLKYNVLKITSARGRW
jgi:predicted metal-dependent hydrolase